MSHLPFMPTFTGPYPPPMPRVCVGCPFGNTVGRAIPTRSEGVLRLAEEGVGWLCHAPATGYMASGDPDRQCRGMAIFRAKQGWQPQHPDDAFYDIGPDDPDWDVILDDPAAARSKWDPLSNWPDKP